MKLFKKHNEKVLHIGKTSLFVQVFFKAENSVFRWMPMKSWFPFAVLNTSHMPSRMCIDRPLTKTHEGNKT